MKKKNEKTYQEQCKYSANQLRELYNAFRAKGFSDDQAFQLVVLIVPTQHYECGN